MRRPTCVEIAEDFDLWQEYVDPDGYTTRQEFEEATLEESLAVIHDLWPGDCNCGWAENQ